MPHLRKGRSEGASALHDLPGGINIKQLFKSEPREINFDS